MSEHAWTPDAVRTLLDRNPRAVERAVLAIYRRQTLDERETEETRHHNEVGFSAFHAGRGSYYARWILTGRRLTGGHLEKARRMMKHYAGQLAGIAQAGHTKEVSHV